MAAPVNLHCCGTMTSCNLGPPWKAIAGANRCGGNVSSRLTPLLVFGTALFVQLAIWTFAVCFRYKTPLLQISAACTNVQDEGFLTVDLAAMGDNMSCSTHCAPNCISRQPPGHDVLEDPPRKSVGRTYPVADPVDLQLNWQTIAVRHAWRKAAEMGDTGIGRPEEGRPLRAAEPAKASAAEAEDAQGRGIDIVKI
eukprot:s1229_g9.t1